MIPKCFSSAILALSALLSPLVSISAVASESKIALPNKVIWAWQRPENLQFINPQEFGVAYLACRALLTENKVVYHWRNQSLRLPDKIAVAPTIRIDVDTKNAPKLNDEQIESLLKVIEQIAHRPGIAEIQIDFDARVTEREFYRKLLNALRQRIPGTPISITALASWCLFDSWIKDLPVDETIPMMFSLGQEREKILYYFKTHKSFLFEGCCKSLGISIEDAEVNGIMIPLVKERKIPVRIFVFSKTAWNEKKIQSVRNLLGEP